MTADNPSNVKFLILFGEDITLKSVALFLIGRRSESAELLTKRLLELLYLR